MPQHRPNVDVETLPTLAHGVRADPWNWISTWNFSLRGTRTAVEMGGVAEGWNTPRTVDIDILRNGPLDAWPEMALSGFMVAVWQAVWLRRGGKVGYGVPPHATRWVSTEAAAQTLRAADRELALEACRRSVAPHAASRLGCIWAAEDNPQGRTWISRMLGTEAFVVPVVVRHALRVSRCDAHWLDAWEDLGETAAEGYWSGEPKANPLWEYLIEGQIACADAEALERVRAFVHEHGPPSDLIAGNANVPERDDA